MDDKNSTPETSPAGEPHDVSRTEGAPVSGPSAAAASTPTSAEGTPTPLAHGTTGQTEALAATLLA
ncbi:hypothetical protein ACFFIR_12730, partial [Microbacterium arthrosphaerae]|uniref:hypothetical protein n=1 Tax=Microbacterium arthrosphaerae TaxID=792652 RepID=UPI0035E53992